MGYAPSYPAQPDYGQMPNTQMPNGQMPNGQVPNGQMPSGMGNGQLPSGQTGPMANVQPGQMGAGQLVPYSQPGNGQSGYMQDGYTQPGYPQPDYAPPSYNPQGYPEQGYPEQGYPGQGYPDQGFPGQGYPEQDSGRKGFGRKKSGKARKAGKSKPGKPTPGQPTPGRQQGYDQPGYDQQGFDTPGYSRTGPMRRMDPGGPDDFRRRPGMGGMGRDMPRGLKMWMTVGGAAVAVVIVIVAVVAFTGGSAKTPATGNGSTASATSAAGNGTTAGGAAGPYKLTAQANAGGMKRDTKVTKANATILINEAEGLEAQVTRNGAGTATGHVSAAYFVSTTDLNSAAFRVAIYIGFNGTFNQAKVIQQFVGGDAGARTVSPGTHGGDMACGEFNGGSICLWSTGTTLGMVEFRGAMSAIVLPTATASSLTLKVRDSDERQAK
jgi:hypothetical protein